ncbi:helix-turn-helix domain-containing protein [Pseudonocardia saturnea]
MSNPSIALAVMVHGRGRFGHAERQHLVGSGDLMLVDLTAPYDFGWSALGASYAVQLPIDLLGLPVEAVRRASGNLRASPLYDLVRRHVVDVTTNAAQISADPGAAAVGEATMQLARALIASAAGLDGPARDAHTVSLLTRVLSYVERHLTEPDLTAERIAHRHNVSLRHLYAVCAAGEVRLEQRIIARRLQGARTELATPAGRRRPIAAIARAWGFSNTAHFHRRFRQAYGVTPGEWRRGHG